MKKENNAISQESSVIVMEKELFFQLKELLFELVDGKSFIKQTIDKILTKRTLLSKKEEEKIYAGLADYYNLCCSLCTIRFAANPDISIASPEQLTQLLNIPDNKNLTLLSDFFYALGTNDANNLFYSSLSPQNIKSLLGSMPNKLVNFIKTYHALILNCRDKLVAHLNTNPNPKEIDIRIIDGFEIIIITLMLRKHSNATLTKERAEFIMTHKQRTEFAKQCHAIFQNKIPTTLEQELALLCKFGLIDTEMMQEFLENPLDKRKNGTVNSDNDFSPLNISGDYTIETNAIISCLMVELIPFLKKLIANSCLSPYLEKIVTGQKIHCTDETTNEMITMLAGIYYALTFSYNIFSGDTDIYCDEKKAQIFLNILSAPEQEHSPIYILCDYLKKQHADNSQIEHQIIGLEKRMKELSKYIKIWLSPSDKISTTDKVVTKKNGDTKKSNKKKNSAKSDQKNSNPKTEKSDNQSELSSSIVYDNKKELSKIEHSEIERLEQQRAQEVQKQKEIEELNKEISRKKDLEKLEKMNNHKNKKMYTKEKKFTTSNTIFDISENSETKTAHTNTQQQKPKISDTFTPATYLLQKKTTDKTFSNKKSHKLPPNLEEVDNILSQIQGISEHSNLSVADAITGGLILAFVSLHIYCQQRTGLYPLDKLNFMDINELKNLRHRLLHLCQYVNRNAVTSFVKDFLEFRSRLESFKENGDFQSQGNILSFSDTKLYRELEKFEKNTTTQDDVAILKNYKELLNNLKTSMKFIESAETLRKHLSNIYVVISYIFKLNNLAQSFSKTFRDKYPALTFSLSTYRNQVAHQNYYGYDALFEGKNLNYEKIFYLAEKSGLLEGIASEILAEIKQTESKKNYQNRAPSTIKYYNTPPIYSNPYIVYSTPMYYQAPSYSPLELIYYALQNFYQDPVSQTQFIVATIQQLDENTWQQLSANETIKEMMAIFKSDRAKEEELMAVIQNNFEKFTLAVYQMAYSGVGYSTWMTP